MFRPKKLEVFHHRARIWSALVRAIAAWQRRVARIPSPRTGAFVQRFGGLHELDLGEGVLGDEQSPVLLAHAKRFAHLKRFALDNNYFTTSSQKALKKAIPGLVFGPQREGDEENLDRRVIRSRALISHAAPVDPGVPYPSSTISARRVRFRSVKLFEDRVDHVLNAERVVQLRLGDRLEPVTEHVRCKSRAQVVHEAVAVRRRNELVPLVRFFTEPPQTFVVVPARREIVRGETRTAQRWERSK